MTYTRMAVLSIVFGMLVALLVRALLGPPAVTRWPAPTPPADPTPAIRDEARAVVFALIALRRADGAYIELRTLSDAVGLSEGQLALELAGNPSIAWRQGAVDWVRWYRYTAATENTP